MRERMCNVGSCRAIKPAEMLILTVRVEPLSFQSSHWKLTHFISKGSKFLKKKKNTKSLFCQQRTRHHKWIYNVSSTANANYFQHRTNYADHLSDYLCKAARLLNAHRGWWAEPLQPLQEPKTDISRQQKPPHSTLLTAQEQQTDLYSALAVYNSGLIAPHICTTIKSLLKTM